MQIIKFSRILSGSLSAVWNMLPGNILQKAPKNRVKIVKNFLQGSQESKELFDLIRYDC